MRRMRAGGDGIQTRAGSESVDTTADAAIKSDGLPEAAGEDSRFEVHFMT